MNKTDYNPNIPLVGTTFDQWQVLFLANFKQMDLAFKANHIALTSASNAGNHSFVQLFEQEDPLQTNIGDFAVYAKEVEDQSDQTFIRYEGNGTEFQYTNYQIYPILETDDQISFFTVLPGKLMVFFGTYFSHQSGKKPPLIKPLILQPGVSKNIVSVLLSPIGTDRAFVAYSEGKNGEFITQLNFAAIQATLKLPDLYYMVVANI